MEFYHMSYRATVSFQLAYQRAARQRAAMRHTAQALRDVGKNALSLKARVFNALEVQS